MRSSLNPCGLIGVRANRQKLSRFLCLTALNYCWVCRASRFIFSSSALSSVRKPNSVISVAAIGGVSEAAEIVLQSREPVAVIREPPSSSIERCHGNGDRGYC